MKNVVFAIAAAALISTACVAADNPTVALEASGLPIAQAAADLSKQAGVKIMVDTDVQASVTGQFASIELEKLLDSITKVAELKWQKLYLPVEEGKEPTLDQVKARAAALGAVSGGTAVVYDPATGKQRVFVEQDPAQPSVAPEKLGLTPVYLISKPKVEAVPTTTAADKDLATRYQTLESERLQLLAQMSPQQRVAAMQSEMLAMMNLDPTVRQQMMIDQMQARRDMDPQTREAYQNMMRETFRNMREQGVFPPDDGRRWGRDRGDGQPEGDRGDFRRRERPQQ